MEESRAEIVAGEDGRTGTGLGRVCRGTWSGEDEGVRESENHMSQDGNRAELEIVSNCTRTT